MVLLLILSSVLAFLPLALYTIISWKKREFNFFSPFFFPIINFIVIYWMPSIILINFENLNIYENAIIIQVIGNISYFLGVGLYILIKRNRQLNETVEKPRMIHNLFTIKLFLAFGIMLLLVYGMWSGVLLSIVKRQSVEDLRRTAEIGKGFIKEPGVFFATFCGVLLFGINLEKKKKMTPLSFLLMLLVMLMIFLTTAHKFETLNILLIIIGLYSRYRKVSLPRVIIFCVVLIAMITVLQEFRSAEDNSGVDENPLNFFILKPFKHSASVYYSVYMPIVRMVDRGDLHLQFGREYIQNAMIIIPRFIFPNKPLAYDYYLKEMLKLDFEGGGAPARIFGSLYLNFSFLGLIIGMAFIGYIYSLLYDIYRKRKDIFKISLSLLFLVYMVNPSLLLSRILLIILFIGVMLIADNIIYLQQPMPCNKINQK